MNHTLSAAALAACVLLAGCASADDEANDAATTDSVTATTPAPAPTTTTGLLDPDAATREELTAVPNITPELADSIIAKRPYADMLAFDKVIGSLSEEQRDTVYNRVFKPIDLNTASGEEIQLIPGVGDRMEHEFEEYRPYTSIEQFRREIGKYVDANEVARLEKYVTIRQ